MSAEQAARAAREGLVDKAAAVAHIRAQADEAEAAAERLRRPDTGPPDRPTGRQRSTPATERDRQDAAARREVEAARLRRLADRIEGAPAAPAKATPAKKATPAPAPDLTGAGGLSSDPAVRAVQVENRIRQAYRDIPSALAGPKWIGLADLRDHPDLQDLPRDEVDAALARLSRDAGVRLAPSEFQSTFAWTGRKEPMGLRDREAAVRVGDSDRHMIRFLDPAAPPRPLPDAAAPAKRTPAKAAKKATRRAQPEGLPPLVTREQWEGWTAQQHRDYASARMKAAQDPGIEMSDALRDSVRRDARQHFAIAASMRREDLDSLSDGELRDRLEARGLSTVGSRAELLARLRG